MRKKLALRVFREIAMANEYTASELNKILGVANGAELLSGKPKATPKELRGYVVKIIVRNMHK